MSASIRAVLNHFESSSVFCGRDLKAPEALREREKRVRHCHFDFVSVTDLSLTVSLSLCQSLYLLYSCLSSPFSLYVISSFLGRCLSVFPSLLSLLYLLIVSPFCVAVSLSLRTLFETYTVIERLFSTSSNLNRFRYTDKVRIYEKKKREEGNRQRKKSLTDCGVCLSFDCTEMQRARGGVFHANETDCTLEDIVVLKRSEHMSLSPTLLFFCLCLPQCLSVSVSLSLQVSVSFSLSISVAGASSLCVSVSLSLCLSLCLSLSLSRYLSLSLFLADSGSDSLCPSVCLCLALPLCCPLTDGGKTR